MVRKSFGNALLTLVLLILCMGAAGCSGVVDKAVQVAVDEANKGCPMVIEKGITMDSFAVEDGALTITYTFDSSMYDVSVITDEPELAKMMLEGMKSDSSGESFVTMVKTAGLDIRCVFKGTDGTSSSVTIPNSEL